MSGVIVSPEAQVDLQEIHDFLKIRASDEVAGRVLEELQRAMHRLADSPGIGHYRLDLADESVRFYRVYRYLIVYGSHGDPLSVIRVLHGARDLRFILSDNA